VRTDQDTIAFVSNSGAFDVKKFLGLRTSSGHAKLMVFLVLGLKILIFFPYLVNTLRMLFNFILVAITLASPDLSIQYITLSRDLLSTNE